MRSVFRPMVTRQALASDQSEWLRMRLLLWPAADHTSHVLEMDRLLNNPLTPVFVLERPDGALGGFLEAGLRPYADGCESSPVAYIEGWFVDRDLRRKGLGRSLMTRAEDWARAQGLREIASDTSIANQMGLEAHTALGFKEVERSIHFAKSL